MIPGFLEQFVPELKKNNECFCIECDNDLNIISTFGSIHQFGLQEPPPGTPLIDFLPVLSSDNFEENFKIPLYNIDKDNVCDIYYIHQEKNNYVILINRSEIFQITQKYQQIAHNQSISKNRFKRLAEKLEIARHELNKSNQEKSALIAMLSHELGTPLTSIIGYSELLLSGELNKDYVKTIHRNAIYLKHTIENTLLFGRSQALENDKQIDAVQVHDLFSELKATLIHAAEKKGLDIHINIKFATLIYIDLHKTRQILINLINNAIKYTSSGHIEICFDENHSNYIFSVEDTGIGIARNELENVFLPWKRVGNNPEKGSGIGLYISQKLAETLDGKLILKYSEKNIGSLFELSLPRENRTPERFDTSFIKPDIVLDDELVLVIDDDDDILDLISLMLEHDGFNIQTVDCIHKAKSFLQQNSVSLILTDMHIGEEDATDYMEEIKEYYNNLPVIVMSALPSKKLMKNYKSMGFDAIIEKPLNKQTLVNTLHKYLNSGS